MAKHESTLRAVFASPTRGNIPWNDIKSLLTHHGAEMSEGAGSRDRVYLNGVRAVFHRPHPEKEAGKPTVRSVQRFLENAGITPS